MAHSYVPCIRFSHVSRLTFCHQLLKLICYAGLSKVMLKQETNAPPFAPQLIWINLRALNPSFGNFSFTGWWNYTL